MSSSTITAQQSPGMPESEYTLKVDFSYRKWQALITEKDDPQSKPLYVVDYKALAPNLVFKSASDDSTFGTGTLHSISIHADCEFRGQQISLRAMKHLKTEYSHLSHTFSDTDTPVLMNWTSAGSFKTWDFICCDPQQLPVAKFSANAWSLKK